MTIWFKNKKTGLKWEVSEPRLIEQLRKDNNYEEIKPKVKPVEKAVNEPNKKKTKKTVTKK